MLNRFVPIIKNLIPNIDTSKIYADQTGIRPRIIYNQDNNPDFIIEWENKDPWLNLFGIESPGLTASLGIAEHVFNKINLL